MKNAELIARLRAGTGGGKHWMTLHTEAASAIEALEAQLKNASVSAIAEAAEVDRMKAEVERLTTLAHGQHIELYNARLQLAAAQGQEPVFWLNEQGQLCATRGYAERHSVGQKLIPLFAALDTAQQEPVNQVLLKALSALLTHSGMDEDEWSKPTFDQARAAIKLATTKTKECGMCGYVGTEADAVGQCPRCHWDELQLQKPVQQAQPEQVNAMLLEALEAAEKLEHAALVALSEATYELKVGNTYTTATDTYKANNELIHRLDKILNLQYRDRKREARLAARQAQPERAPLSCTWTQEDDFDTPGVYHTSCGEMWSFTEGGIKENNTKFCPHCGGGIKQGGQHHG